MHKKYFEIETWPEVVDYFNWAISLTKQDRSERDIASIICALFGNDNYEKWQDDPRFPEFIEVMEAASDLEVKNGDEERLTYCWQCMKSFTKELDKKVNEHAASQASHETAE